MSIETNGTRCAQNGDLFNHHKIQEAMPVRAAPILAADMKIVQLPTRLFHTPPGNRPIELEDVQHDLLPSMEEHGQLVPGISCPHPTIPEAYECLDGNSRLFCCNILGIGFKTVLLDKPVPNGQVIRLRVTVNTMSKHMNKAELGADILDLMEEEGLSQGEAGAVFNWSESYTSKLVAPFKRGIPELLSALRARLICATAVAKIAALTPEKQLIAVQKGSGKKRAAIDRIVEELSEKKPKAKKPVTLKRGGVIATVRGDLVTALTDFINACSTALLRVKKDPALVAILPDLIAGKSVGEEVVK